jgi:uncharacterized phiE125 gp8 family phage protein
MHHTRRTAAPARRAVTLADALAQVREFEGDNGAGDALLEAYIAAAHDACEQRTERALITSDWLLTLDAFPAADRFNPHAAIALRACPVQSVLSIKYDDADGVERTLDTAAYRVSPTQEPALITPVAGTTWPTTLDAPGAVRVAYRAGYGATPDHVPEPLKQWIRLAVGDLYERRNASAEQPATPHQFVDALLQPYRLLGI